MADKKYCLPSPEFVPETIIVDENMAAVTISEVTKNHGFDFYVDSCRMVAFSQAVESIPGMSYTMWPMVPDQNIEVMK